jgi:hypothetical protein
MGFDGGAAALRAGGFLREHPKGDGALPDLMQKVMARLPTTRGRELKPKGPDTVSSIRTFLQLRGQDLNL